MSSTRQFLEKGDALKVVIAAIQSGQLPLYFSKHLDEDELCEKINKAVYGIPPHFIDSRAQKISEATRDSVIKDIEFRAGLDAAAVLAFYRELTGGEEGTEQN